MATLVKARINYADEFDTYGFAVFYVKTRIRVWDTGVVNL